MEVIMKNYITVLLIGCLLFAVVSCDKNDQDSVKPGNYKLTTQVTPSNGGNISRSTDLMAYTADTKVTLTATSAAGYRFVRWEGSVTGPSNPVMLTMNEDKNVTAVFAAVSEEYKLTIDVIPTNGGSVTKTPDQNLYAAGTTVTLNANPAGGFRFTRWEGGATGTSSSVTITINGDKTITADFTAVVNPHVKLPQKSFSFSSAAKKAGPPLRDITKTNEVNGEPGGIKRPYPDGTP